MLVEAYRSLKEEGQGARVVRDTETTWIRRTTRTEIDEEMAAATTGSNPKRVTNRKKGVGVGKGL